MATTTKKTTAAKPAAKKTTAAAKPAAKKTAAAKPAVKKAAPVKTAVELSVTGNKKIKTLEKEFDTVFGLYAQVCYTEKDGHRYYTSGSADDMTLAAFNKKCEANGCKKGEWK